MMKRLILSFALALAALGVAAQSITPYGTPTNATVTGTAASASVPTVAKGGSGQMELLAVCSGTVPCFFRYDGVTATTSNGFPLMANQAYQVKVPANTSAFSVISTGAGSTFYLFAVR